MKNQSITLIHYGELSLKGRNRCLFEDKLLDNIERATGGKVTKYRGYFVLEGGNCRSLKYVFGIAWYAKAIRVEKRIEAMVNVVLKEIDYLTESNRTFGVFVRRSDKSFPYRSMEIEKLIGEIICRRHELTVDLKHPELNIFIEIGEDAYIYFDKIQGMNVTESSGLAGVESWNTTSACSGDYNGDGNIDIYVTNIGRSDSNALYRNNGDGTFTNITRETSTNDVGDGRTCAWIDFDADGRIDLFSTNHLNPNRLYRNLGGDAFVDVAPSVGIDKPIDVFAATWGDYNRDGFMDVFLNGHIGTGLMKNSGNTNKSITLRC